MKNIKIFILGAPKVGKTSLIHQILFGPTWIKTRSKDILPTTEDVYFATFDATQIHSGEESISSTCDDRLLLFDVAGIMPRIDIESLRTYINLADEFILVYSIDDKSTFNLVDTVKKFIDQIKGKRDNPIIVLGNKVDLDSQRQVGFDEALVWAKRENAKLFEVTSFERDTILDFTRFLSSQLTIGHAHLTSSFKLRRSKTNQSTSG